MRDCERLPCLNESRLRRGTLRVCTRRFGAWAELIVCKCVGDPSEDITAIDPGFEFSIFGIEAATGQPTDSAEGEGIVPYFGLVPVGVTADNIAETVIADGFLTVADICTGDVADADFCQANA